jgi:hypothetical protein
MNRIEIPRSGSSRRAFLGTLASAGTVLGVGLASSRTALAHNDDDASHRAGGLITPIPGGLAPFAPFGIFIHHNPLKPGTPLGDINDPSQINDFDGFVGLTHIRGGGTGTDTATGMTSPLAYQADMGFSQGKFMGADGNKHKGTFAFV